MQITSPTGSSPTPSEGSTPPANDYMNIEAHGLKLPLPKRVAFAVSILIMLLGAIPVFTQVLLPIIKEHAVTGKTEKEKTHHTSPRFNEYQQHFSETPTSTEKFFDSPTQGSLSVSFYASDGCLLVKRKGPGPNQAEIPYWVPAKSITLEAPPAAPDGVKESQLETPPPNETSLNATYQFASFNHISAPASPPRGAGCADAHPGQFQTWNGEQKGCWIQVWRRWPDRCQHFQWFNTCNGYWDNHPNGAPRVSWTNCVH